MADELDVLLERVDDAALRADLHTAIQRVKAKRSFGLVFESHLPERVRLPDHPIRRGVRVVHRDADDEPRLVSRVKDGSATLIGTDDSTEDVVVAEFGQAIYPGLIRLGSIDCGASRPAHVVINAENHHALEALQFTHAGASTASTSTRPITPAHATGSTTTTTSTPTTATDTRNGSRSWSVALSWPNNS